MRKRWVISAVILAGMLAGWVTWDLTNSQPHSLRDFDGHEVGRLETAMWRSYYGHRSVRLFTELVAALRQQYHLPFWRACVGAYHAARAAVVFQSGHNRSDYERALPNLIAYYKLIRQGSDIAFPVEKTARLELEWWIVHRERARHAEGDLDRALADLQAEIYQQPPARFRDHARDRAAAMQLRDSGAETGGVSDRDWMRIGALLDSSWVSLQAAVAQ